jgi:hypothetical protein
VPIEPPRAVTPSAATPPAPGAPFDPEDLHPHGHNTRIVVLYRDASNYKQTGHFVFPGAITAEQSQRIMANLDQGEFFIPTQLGLPHLATDGEWAFPGQDDHVWHELVEITVVEAPATQDEAVDGFVQRFAATTWNVDGAMAELHIEA